MDWWSEKLWNGDPFVKVRKLQEKLNSGAQNAHIAQTDFVESERALVYALSRGLCGDDAPHHKRSTTDVDGKLRYNIPSKRFSLLDVSVHQLPDFNWTVSGDFKVDDFVDGATDIPFPTEDDSKQVRWAPVKIVRSVPKLDIEGAARESTLAVAEAVVYEHLVDYYKAASFKNQDNKSDQLFLLACAAAAKVKQLPSMTVVARAHARSPSTLLCNPHPTGRDGKQHMFITRPVMRCFKGEVLYPCDAGLAGFSYHKLEEDEDVEKGQPKATLPYDYTRGRLVEGFGVGSMRSTVKRSDATSIVRAVVADSDQDKPPIYIAPHAGTSGPISNPTPPQPRDMPVNVFPNNPEMVKVDRVRASLQQVFKQLDEIDKLAETVKDAKKELKENVEKDPEKDKEVDMQECDARTRREAVWNDGLREASIAGDRLYAFVRQLSGAISESIDAVCQIDEGQLIRQQQQTRDRRARAADRAAQEHAQLVRNVFTSVIKDSEFVLGIQGGGGAGGGGSAGSDAGSSTQDIGELKVVSNTLRKQAQDLTQQGSGSEGFFTNAVKLEQLLAKGTGEMSLKDLFGSLRDAGLQMQRDAVKSEMENATSSGGASLEFLSAPRNSLVLRYKPEALSAIRESYDIFVKEMSYVNHKWQFIKISAWELMEGHDETLSNAFAVFCAHKLAHSRMFSSSHVGYVAQWPAKANNVQLKIALRRLVVAASAYIGGFRRPNFASDKPADARASYFR
jgi:hypothetical protein